MKRKSTLIIIAAASVLNSSFGADKPIKMKDLPPAVQKALQAQTKGAEVRGLSKEVENGKTFYEVETVVNGRGRDLLLDKAGALVEIEEEVALDSIPAPASGCPARQFHVGCRGTIRRRLSPTACKVHSRQTRQGPGRSAIKC